MSVLVQQKGEAPRLLSGRLSFIDNYLFKFHAQILHGNCSAFLRIGVSRRSREMQSKTENNRSFKSIWFSECLSLSLRGFLILFHVQSDKDLGNFHRDQREQRKRYTDQPFRPSDIHEIEQTHERRHEHDQRDDRR